VRAHSSTRQRFEARECCLATNTAQKPEDPWGKVLGPRRHLASVFRQEMISQKNNIILSLAKWRKMDRNDIQAIVEVLPRQKGFSHPASLSVISPRGEELKESSHLFAGC
jgi:hypothetical protein